MNRSISFMLLGSMLLVACGYYPAYSMPARGMGNYGNDGGGNYASNGEQIYFTAINQSGIPIPYSGGPAYGGMMMGSYLACDSCHGPDGRGGTHFMHMQVMDAPPIYYEALVEMLKEESDGTPQPDEYTLDDFRKSVVDGQHPDGDQLDPDMPRWKMSDQELSDLFDFIKSLP